MRSCVVCGEEAPRRLLLRLERKILRCEHCGLVFADQQGAAVHEYPESYYRGGVYADYLAERAAIRRNARRALREIERLAPGRRLLDVGCALGFFLEAARERGWSVSGLDVSAYAVACARDRLGPTVWQGSIVSPPDGLGSHDAVTLWDAIEHVDRPDLALARIRERLHPRGVLAISTGDYGCLLRRVMGRRWRLFRDPTHSFFFDPYTLRRLLERQGFEVLSLAHRGKWVSLAMGLHQSGLRLAGRLLAGPTMRRRELCVYVNLWDVMTVLARPHQDAGSPAPVPMSPAGWPAT